MSDDRSVESSSGGNSARNPRLSSSFQRPARNANGRGAAIFADGKKRRKASAGQSKHSDPPPQKKKKKD